MKISEILADRRGDKVLEKGTNLYVPFDVYSFDTLDTVHGMQQIKKEYQDLLCVFMQIADNIIYDHPDGSEDKLLKLAQDFQDRLVQIKLEAGEMFKSGSMCLFKADNGQLQWMGVPTNKFIDRDNDILSDYAHRQFVAKVKAGEIPYPDLYPWHTGTVGKSTWIDYDERGFLVAGGYILPEYEQFVTNLVINTKEALGMSHGMYKGDIVRDKDGIIIAYKSFEFSFLPQSKAANLLTSFATVGS